MCLIPFNYWSISNRRNRVATILRGKYADIRVGNKPVFQARARSLQTSGPALAGPGPYIHIKVDPSIDPLNYMRAFSS